MSGGITRVDLYWNFYDDDVITVPSLVLRTCTQSVQYFAQQFSFATRKC